MTKNNKTLANKFQSWMAAAKSCIQARNRFLWYETWTTKRLLWSHMYRSCRSFTKAM